jgi:hypothetical protein
MRLPSNPYRLSACPDGEPGRGTVGLLLFGERIAHGFVLGWAFLRVALCAVRGLDVEGFVALVIVVSIVVPPGRTRA